MAEDSGNVADDGNYSIQVRRQTRRQRASVAGERVFDVNVRAHVQVIEEALKVWNLTCHSLTNPEMKEAKDDPLYVRRVICSSLDCLLPLNPNGARFLRKEQAFICNLSSHWLTIRKIGEDWYNFNR
jgi:hypothetical protein